MRCCFCLAVVLTDLDAYANIRSMPLDEPSYVRFRAALNGGDVAEAFDVAKRLSGLLSLLDALELTLLAAKKGWEGPFQDCAARWIARVAVEKEMKLDQVASAAAIFQEASRGENEDAFRLLAGYL